MHSDNEQAIEVGDAQGKAVGVGVNVSETPLVKAGAERVTFRQTSLRSLARNRDIALRQLRTDDFIRDLKDCLAACGKERLYIILDDYSELPPDAMHLFAACILEPFDTMAYREVHFKIAVYPGRDKSLGNIDQSRLDKIDLDPFSLFKASDTVTRDARGVEFVSRLVTNRVSHFCKCPPSTFFDGEENRIWQTLYFASAANPRTIGHILYALLEQNLEHGRKIDIDSIRQAALAHFNDRIETVFDNGRFADEVLNPKGTAHTHKALLARLVSRAQALANSKRPNEPAAFAQIRPMAEGRIPVSHFRVSSQLEDMLATLELNSFITKYTEYIDFGALKFSVYTFNYGLCQLYKLPWYGTRAAEKHQSFYTIDDLDFSQSVVGYYNEAVEFVCPGCQHREPFGSVEALRRFDMLCPKCKNATMLQEAARSSFGPAPSIPKPELAITEAEFEIVALLGESQKPLTAREMSPELDQGPQEVGLRATALADRGIVQAGTRGGRRTYRLTARAQESYSRIKVAKAAERQRLLENAD